MSACWDLQMPPTAKAVLISLADNANDAGYCWPSLAAVSRRTCFSRTAVIEAIKWLEAEGYLHADRSDRYHTTYVVTPVKTTEKQGQGKARKQYAKQTSTPAVLVRQTDNEVREPNNEVREPDTNRQEPSRTVKKERGASAPSCPDDVDPQTWADWLALRKAKKAPVTETVLKSARSEAGKAGVTLDRFLEIWCARGSQGLEASWLKPHERAGPRAGPAKHGDFEQRDYGTGGLM